MSTDHLPTYLPTWVDVIDLDAGPRFWIVYDSAEGFQPRYAIVQESNAQDAEEAAEAAAAGYLQTDRDTLVIQPVSANWAEGTLRQIPIADQDDYLYELLDPDNACNTCGGTRRWESTTEEAPTTLIDLGPCPDCL